MVDTLKSAASFLKSKWSKDELTQTLNSAINDEDCQPSTNLMHQLANSTYSLEDWGKIWTFIQQRLNSGKGVRVNKGLSVLEFLLKNGNEAIVKDLKKEIRLLRDLERFEAKGESDVRIKSIHRKAQIVIELMNNPKRLIEERAQAQAIKLKLGNNYSIKTNLQNSNNTNSKPVLTTKSSYDGIGSGYNSFSNAQKQQSNLSKVTGMASNLVKGIANKIKGNSDVLLNDNESYKNYADYAKSNNSQCKPQMTPTEKKQPGKLFDKLNVRKPAGGITKTHSNINIVPTPKAVRSEIKSEPNIPAPQINFFDSPVKNQPVLNNNNNIDFFGFGNEDMPISKPSSTFDLFDFNSNTNTKPTLPSTNKTNNLLINNQQSAKSVSYSQSTDFDIFSFDSEPIIQTKTTALAFGTPVKQSTDLFSDLLF